MQDVIEQENRKLIDFYKENINVIFDNRQELRGIKKRLMIQTAGKKSIPAFFSPKIRQTADAEKSRQGK